MKNSDPKKTIFVANLSYKTDEQKLKSEFQIFGKIRRIRIIVDKTTAKSRGYAFIEYEHTSDMENAFERGNGRRVDGRRVIVDVVRGRLDSNWLPRRLGGGRGGTRRDREDEKMIEEIKKAHPELRNRSRSRSRDHTKQGNESHHKKSERDRKQDDKEEKKHSNGDKNRRRDESGDKKSKLENVKEENKDSQVEMKSEQYDDSKKKKSSKNDKKKKDKDKKKHKKRSRSQKERHRERNAEEKINNQVQEEKKVEVKAENNKVKAEGNGDDEAEPGEINE